MSFETLLLMFVFFFAALTTYCATKMVAFKDELDIERACHRLTRAALDEMAKTAHELRFGKPAAGQSPGSEAP